jgi:antitoxin component of MazEF toxin-antitoxin module
MARYIRLRQNGNSIGMTIPHEFCHALGLQPGDSVHWEAVGDVAKLRFFRVTEQRIPAAEQGEEVAVDAA